MVPPKNAFLSLRLPIFGASYYQCFFISTAQTTIHGKSFLFYLILKCVKFSSMTRASWQGNGVILVSSPEINFSFSLRLLERLQVSGARSFPDLGSLPHPLVLHPPWVGFLAQKHCNAWVLAQTHCNTWFLEQKRCYTFLNTKCHRWNRLTWLLLLWGRPRAWSGHPWSMQKGDGHHFNDTDQWSWHWWHWTSLWWHWRRHLLPSECRLNQRSAEPALKWYWIFKSDWFVSKIVTIHTQLVKMSSKFCLHQNKLNYALCRQMSH